MVPGFKYHVATIAAIFFALTAGLVVGSLYVSPQLADGQRRAIRSLNETLNRDLAAQKTEIARADRFTQGIVPEFVKNRLQGETVTLIQTGDYPETLAQVRDTLTAAGAEIVGVAKIGKMLNRSSSILLPALASFAQTDPEFPGDRSALVKAVLSILLNDEKSVSVLDKLSGADLLTCERLSSPPAKPSTVVFIGGSRSESSGHIENVDQYLLRALLGKRIRCLACEGQEVAVSEIALYRLLHLEISTVDNVDTLRGRCALVMAFSAEPDDYGVKPTARQLLPSGRN